MTAIEAIVILTDGSDASYTLDPKQTIAELRELLNEDGYLDGEETFTMTETRSKIPKSQEKVKTLEALANGGTTVKLSLVTKTQPEQKPEETKTESPKKLSESSISSPSKRTEEELSRSNSRNVEGFTDVMGLSNSEVGDLLNKCSYLYGRKVDRDGRVTEAPKKFFADIAENRQFQQSNRSSQNKFEKKHEEMSSQKDQESFSKGYGELNIKASVKLIAKVQGHLSHEKNEEETKSEKKKCSYDVSVYSGATFKLQEVRSTISDDVKNFFKPGEAKNDRRMNEFLETFGAFVPEVITVGGKRYTASEGKSKDTTDSVSKKDKKGIFGFGRFKIFQAGGDATKTSEKEKKVSKSKTEEMSSIHCFGGNPKFKDQPAEWENSVCKDWTTWQIIEVPVFRYTFEYLDEPFRSWFKNQFFPDAKETIQYGDEEYYEKYVGQVQAGKRHGKGELTWKNGDIYTGMFKNDFAQGKFELIRKDRDGVHKYRMEFNNGITTERDIKWTKPNGDVYRGQCTRDLQFRPHGEGVLKYADGDTLQGYWKNGMLHGPATYIQEGSEIEVRVEFFEGKQNAKGKIIDEDEGVYEGDIVSYSADGFGKFTWNDGRTYVGDWLEDMKHGKGKFEANDGESLEGGIISYDGDWVEDEMHGKGFAIEEDGSSYEGSFKKGHYSGHGIFLLSDDASREDLTIVRYEGHWSHGEQNGKGEAEFDNGWKYKGEFKKGKPNGEGKLYRHGKWKEGEWTMKLIKKKLEN